MLYVDRNPSTGLEVINLTRGDDAALEIPLTGDDGEPYEMDATEYLLLGVRQRPTEASELLLELHSEPGGNRIEFRHADTADLKPGEYSADIQLMTRDGQRVTVWPKLTGSMKTSTSSYRNFCLMTEVVME